MNPASNATIARTVDRHSLRLAKQGNPRVPVLTRQSVCCELDESLLVWKRGCYDGTILLACNGAVGLVSAGLETKMLPIIVTSVRRDRLSNSLGESDLSFGLKNSEKGNLNRFMDTNDEGLTRASPSLCCRESEA